MHSGILAAVLTGAALSASACLAQDQILTNEPSRGALFATLAQRSGVQSLLPQTFAFPADTRDDAIFGIDVSHYTQDGCKCQINWTAAPTDKVFFVYLKATQSTAFIDATFSPNWKTLQSFPNIRRGAYHFLSGDADPTAQAQHFLSKLGPLQPNDMPPCVDLEWDFRTVKGQQHDTWSDLTPDQIIDRVQTWINVVEKATGRRPLIYTNAVWWNDRIKDATKFTKFHDYPIWIADYSPSGRGQEIPQVPDKQPWTIWQFTESGVVTSGAVPGKLDVSIFKGSSAQFAQSFGLPPTATASVPGPTTASVPATDTAPPAGPTTTPTSAPTGTATGATTPASPGTAASGTVAATPPTAPAPDQTAPSQTTPSQTTPGQTTPSPATAATAPPSTTPNSATGQDAGAATASTATPAPPTTPPAPATSSDAAPPAATPPAAPAPATPPATTSGQ
jgi:lysozyme